MSKRLAGLILVTDTLFLTYWFFSLLHIFGLFELPASMMYGDFEEPRVFAWNWSFFPIDVLFSLSGLLAVRLSRRGDPRWRPVAIISLCLTFVAGFMACAYWAIFGEFDPAWFLPNLALVIWPLFFLPSLINAAAQPT
jgi:hypothetical protein